MSMKILLAILMLLAVGVAQAGILLMPTSVVPSGPSCLANITGSGADGNPILTGSATALANLTCQ